MGVDHRRRVLAEIALAEVVVVAVDLASALGRDDDRGVVRVGVLEQLSTRGLIIGRRSLGHRPTVLPAQRPHDPLQLVGRPLEVVVDDAVVELVLGGELLRGDREPGLDRLGAVGAARLAAARRSARRLAAGR